MRRGGCRAPVAAPAIPICATRDDAPVSRRARARADLAGADRTRPGRRGATVGAYVGLVLALALAAGRLPVCAGRRDPGRGRPRARSSVSRWCPRRASARPRPLESDRCLPAKTSTTWRGLRAWNSRDDEAERMVERAVQGARPHREDRRTRSRRRHADLSRRRCRQRPAGRRAAAVAARRGGARERPRRDGRRVSPFRARARRPTDVRSARSQRGSRRRARRRR